MDKKRIMIGIVIAAAAVLCISLFLNGHDRPSESSPEKSGPVEVVNAGEEDDDDPIVEIRPEELTESAEKKNEEEKPSGSDRKEEEETSSGSGQEKNTQVKEEKKPEKESDQENKEEQQEENSSEAEPIQGDDAWTDYDTFLAKSPAEQDAFMKSFDSPEAFANWLVKAQKEWAAAHPAAEIGPDGVIDFGR